LPRIPLLGIPHPLGVTNFREFHLSEFHCIEATNSPLALYMYAGAHIVLAHRQGSMFVKGLGGCSTCGTDESRPTVKEVASMRRIIFILTAATLTVVLMAITGAPAFAKWSNCGGDQGPCGWKVVLGGKYKESPYDANSGIGWGAEYYG